MISKMEEKKVERQFIESSNIHPEHSNLEVRQATCWVCTSDKKIVQVSKDNIKWNLPGGHPENNETAIEACIREVNQESGLDISELKDQIKILGYYVITETDANSSETYLQVRFVLNHPESSESLDIHPNEEEDEVRKILYANAFDIDTTIKQVPWMENSSELKAFQKYLAN